MKIFNYTLILFVTLALFSCGGGSDSDGTAPEVKFTSPSTSASSPTLIGDGDVVNFVGTISDNKSLKSIVFTDLLEGTKSITDFKKDFNLKLNSKKPNSTSVLDKDKFSVNFSIDPLDGSPTKDYTLTCTVIDNSGNPTTKTFYIKVK
jgi:hypothetical protein